MTGTTTASGSVRAGQGQTATATGRGRPRRAGVLRAVLLSVVVALLAAGIWWQAAQVRLSAATMYGVSSDVAHPDDIVRFSIESSATARVGRIVFIGAGPGKVAVRSVRFAPLPKGAASRRLSGRDIDLVHFRDARHGFGIREGVDYVVEVDLVLSDPTAGVTSPGLALSLTRLGRTSTRQVLFPADLRLTPAN